MSETTPWSGHKLVKRPPRHVWQEVDGELEMVCVDGVIGDESISDLPAPRDGVVTSGNLQRYECVDCGQAKQGWGVLVRRYFVKMPCAEKYNYR